MTREMADEVERRDDDDGWEDREGRQREWQGDVRRQGVETECVEVGGQRKNGNAWNGNRRGEDQENGGGQQQFPRGEGAQGVESGGVYVRERLTSWEDWVRRVQRLFDERQGQEGVGEDGRREVDWRPEMRR